MNLSLNQATKIARRYKMPRSRSEYVKLPSVEVTLAFMALHGVTKTRWMGDVLVVTETKARMETEAQDDTTFSR